MDNVEASAEKNNLRLNRRKSVEIIFTEGRCRPQSRVTPPPHLPEVTRVTTLKILGSSLSVAQHVNDIICACSPSLHALRVLRNHGMGDSALQIIYRAVVVAKLLYAASAWWAPLPLTGNASRGLEAVLRRGVRAGLYEAERPTIAHLVESNPAVSSDQLQQPLTAQTTARSDEPWLPAEAEAT